MRLSRTRFGDLIKSKFVGRLNKKNEALRITRKCIEEKRDALLIEYIDPLNRELRDIEKNLKQSCEHPKELVDVKVEYWHEDDGEGNSWSGDTVIVTCKSCGFRANIQSNADGYNTEKFKSSEAVIGKVNLNDTWKLLLEEVSREQREWQQKYNEEQEREQYNRLKKKYG